MRTHAQLRKPVSRSRGGSPGVAPPASLKGPAAVRQILHGPRLQPKLTVGPPDDAYEREANRVADAVMRMPEPGWSGEGVAGGSSPPRIQRLCDDCEDEMEVQRACSHCAEETRLSAQNEDDEKKAMRDATAAGVPEVTPDLEAQVRSLQGGGEPLPAASRAFFEPRFGRDFSGVRVHTGGAAAGVAAALRAKAFTTGNQIVFGHGQYAPETDPGQRLLAHELTHVVQQGEGDLGIGRQLQRSGNGGLNCPPYATYDKSKGLTSYNCAGLAHRTYDYKSLAQTQTALASGSGVACGTPCSQVGDVKHWLWEYDVHYEDSSGTQAAGSDFHTVGGPTDGDPMPKDSDEFFTKNGKRKVYGPGTTPSFKPPAKEQATKNEPAETPQFDKNGKPIYKLRSNFTESCFCFPCPKSSKSP